MTTPVALITRRSDGAESAARRADTPRSIAPTSSSASGAGGRTGTDRRRLRSERVDHGRAAVLRLEREHGGALTKLFDGWDRSHQI